MDIYLERVQINVYPVEVKRPFHFLLEAYLFTLCGYSYHVCCQMCSISFPPLKTNITFNYSKTHVFTSTVKEKGKT